MINQISMKTVFKRIFSTVLLFSLLISTFANIAFAKTTGPTVRLRGESNIAVSINTTFVDPGAYIVDENGDYLSSNFVISGNVDFHTVGVYTLTYSGLDNDGNPASPATRTVTVFENINNAPVITLLGSSPVHISVGNPFTDPGATAFDQEDKDITSKIKVTGSVDTNTVGQYSLIYSVLDSKNLPASSIERTVIVDPIAVLTPINPPATCANGTELNIFEFKNAMDSGKVSFAIATNTANTKATLTVKNTTGCTVPVSLSSYKMYDKVLSHQVLFNKSSLIHATSSVQVTIDLPACMAQIDAWYGDAPATLLDSNPYSYPNNPNVVAWKFLFNNGSGYSDASGAFCSNVTPINHAPVITVIGDNPATVIVGSQFADPGATATDQEDGVITDKIVKTTNLNINAVGTYTITYKVTDKGGLSDTKTRTVKVVDKTVDTNVEIKISATKIVCDSESSLPNWGTNGGPDITPTTATDFLTSHTNCHLQPNWKFQWSDSTTVDPGAKFIGEANGWNTFGVTDSKGVATTTISIPTASPYIWVREVLKDNYLSFTYPGDNNSTSAEMYCSTDVINYDNYDMISGPFTSGKTYNCVAFNVLKTPAPQCLLPEITSSLTASATVGTPFEYNLTASSTSANAGVVSYTVSTTTLPAGLTFATTTTTQKITGTPTVAGTFNVTLRARNNCGLTNETLVLTVAPAQTNQCSVLNIESFSKETPVILTHYNPFEVGVYSASFLTQNAIGGELDVAQDKIGEGDGDAIISGLQDQYFSTNYGPNSKGIVTLVFDGKDNNANTINYTGLSNTDITFGGKRDSIVFKYSADFVNNAKVPVTITVYSDAGHSSKLTLDLYGTINDIHTATYKFSDFIPVIGGGADMTKVGAIVVKIDATSREAIDFAMGDIFSPCVTTPPPPVDQPPVLTLIGENPMTIVTGDIFSDPGATAIDKEDGDITAKISTTTNLNINIVGTYKITYTVTDKGGHTVTKDRTINVIPPSTNLSGSINVCLVLADQNNVVATTSYGLPSGVFDLKLSTSSSLTYPVSTTWNSTTFVPNTKLVSNQFDAHCVKYSNLDIKDYYYSKLNITGARWNSALYNDQDTQPVNNVFDFFTYSSTTPVANTNSDGRILLSADRKDRTLVMYAKYNPAPQCLLPEITSSLTASATVGTPFEYNLTASSTSANAGVVSYTVSTTTLPAGLTFATTTTTQKITGTPTVAGTFNVTLRARNNCGLTNETLVLTVAPATCTSNCGGGGSNNPPVITVIGDNPATIVVGSPFTDPGATATDQEDGNITAKIATTTDLNINTVGTYTITYKVTDTGGLSDTKTRTVKVVPAQCLLPEITSSLTASATKDQAFTYTFTASSTSPVLSVATTTLPTGLTYSTTTQQITGVPTIVGTYNITLNAENSCGLTSKTLVLTVADNTIGGGCTVNCGGGGGGGGGGGNGPVIQSLYIFNEAVIEPTPGIAMVTWNTNVNADRRVVYGNESIASSTLSMGGNYGYATGTETVKNPLLTSHSMVVNIDSGRTYYFRPVSSDGTNTVLGKELNITKGTVAGASTDNSCYYLYDYLRRDLQNNPVEVKKLQIFLNSFEGENLAVNGIYDLATEKAVDNFQNKYKGDILTPWGHTAPTGYTYILTKKKVNEIYCRKAFPVTPQQQNEIDTFRNFLQSLRNENITVEPKVETVPTVLENNIIGQSTSTGSNSSNSLTTLAGVSSTTKNIASDMTANVIGSGRKIGNLALAFLSWPFGLFSSNGICSTTNWVTWILIIIIIVISILWYREYSNNRKIEKINEEIDLDK